MGGAKGDSSKKPPLSNANDPIHRLDDVRQEAVRVDEWLPFDAVVAREWQWLHEILNKVARGRAGDDEVHAFRLLQHHAVAVGQRRVELQIEMARLGGRRT